MKELTNQVREHLHQQYLQKGGDFIFKTKRLHERTAIPTGKLRQVMVRLLRNKTIARYNPRFYVTSFGKSTSVENQLVSRLTIKEHLLKVLHRKV